VNEVHALAQELLAVCSAGTGRGQLFVTCACVGAMECAVHGNCVCVYGVCVKSQPSALWRIGGMACLLPRMEAIVTMVTMGGDLQPGCLADRLLDLQWLQWLQGGVTFSQVVWLIGC